MEKIVHTAKQIVKAKVDIQSAVPWPAGTVWGFAFIEALVHAENRSDTRKQGQPRATLR